MLSGIGVGSGYSSLSPRSAAPKNPYSRKALWPFPFKARLHEGVANLIRNGTNKKVVVAQSGCLAFSDEKTGLCPLSKPHMGTDPQCKCLGGIKKKNGPFSTIICVSSSILNSQLKEVFHLNTVISCFSAEWPSAGPIIQARFTFLG